MNLTIMTPLSTGILIITLILILALVLIVKRMKIEEIIEDKEEVILVYENNLFKRKIFIELLRKSNIPFKLAEERKDIFDIIKENNIKIAFLSEDIDNLEEFTSLNIKLIGFYNKDRKLSDVIVKGFNDGLQTPTNKMMLSTKLN